MLYSRSSARLACLGDAPVKIEDHRKLLNAGPRGQHGSLGLVYLSCDKEYIKVSRSFIICVVCMRVCVCAHMRRRWGVKSLGTVG